MASKKLSHVLLFPQSVSPLFVPRIGKPKRKRTKNFNPAKLFVVVPKVVRP